jgi:hypothetical protein
MRCSRAWPRASGILAISVPPSSNQPGPRVGPGRSRGLLDLVADVDQKLSDRFRAHPRPADGKNVRCPAWPVIASAMKLAGDLGVLARLALASLMGPGLQRGRDHLGVLAGRARAAKDILILVAAVRAHAARVNTPACQTEEVA